jgi:hypothetical protein
VQSDLLDLRLKGGDAEFYNSYALGYESQAISAWSYFLAWLNDFDLYSQVLITYCLLVMSFFIIPYMVYKLSEIRKSKYNSNSNIFWGSFFIINLYASLYMVTFDIYRDVVMLFILLAGFLSIKKYMYSNGVFSSLFWFFSALLISLVLFEFRGYLGFSFLMATIISIFKNSNFLQKIIKIPTFLLITIYVILVNIIFHYGLFNSLLNYRQGFELMSGNTNLGLTFSGSASFIPEFILSASYQLLGLWFSSPIGIFFFMIESLPFLLMISWMLRNKRHATNFVLVIFVFFLIYNTIWLIGNDNFGTALRLRIMGYVPMLAAFFLMFNEKYHGARS